MFIEDGPKKGYKVYREKSPGIDNDRKAIKQGVQVDDQDDNSGEYTLSKPGGEQSWQYTTPKSGERHDIGAWSQVVPAILKSSGEIQPILDKTLALDNAFDPLAQGSSSDDDHTKARLAEETADGSPGIIVACLNHEKEEKIFFPLSESQLKVDHLTVPNHSTKIYDVKADGTIDLANVGTTKDILRIEGNETHLRTVSKFHNDTTKKGPLDFTNNSYPSITIPGTPANYEVQLVWDAGALKWKWIAIGEASSTSLTYARIRWNYSGVSDLTEAELMTYDSVTGLFSATGTAIWIDSELSKQVQFWTGGDDTIFMVRKIKDDEYRSGVTRDLYYAFHCFSDHGVAITHLSRISSDPPSRLYGKILSTDLNANPWDNIVAATVNTTIVGAPLANQMLVNIPSEWTTGGTKDWNFVEVSDFSRGRGLWFRPIRPIMDDVLNNFYRSAQEFAVTGTISEYERL